MSLSHWYLWLMVFLSILIGVAEIFSRKKRRYRNPATPSIDDLEGEDL